MDTARIHPPSKNIKTNTGDRQTHHLPEEIVEQILPHLPVKSLLRFKCVSKSWRCLISSKQFIKTHLEKSTNNESFSHHRIISSFSKPAPTLKSCSLSSVLTETNTHTSPFYSATNNNTATDLVIIGTYKGLICILINRRHFYLWNPATRESKKLADFFTGCEYMKSQGGLTINRYGLGFDESSGDYKVYAFFSVVQNCHVTVYIRGRVYSFKSNSWRVGDFYENGLVPFDNKTDETSGKFSNGKLHWINNKPDSNWNMVCLDLKSETFGIVEKPSFIEGDSKPSLGVIDGCLCVFCDHRPTRFDLWIWKEYGVVDSWVKVFSFSFVNDSWKVPNLIVVPPSSTPLCVLPNGEVLFTYGSILVIYNPKGNRFLQRYIDNFDDVRQVEVYAESLVSLVLDDDDGEQERQP